MLLKILKDDGSVLLIGSTSNQCLAHAMAGPLFFGPLYDIAMHQIANVQMQLEFTG